MAPPLTISLPDLPDDVREILLARPGGELSIDPVTLAARPVGGRRTPLAAGDVAGLVTAFLDHLRIAESLKPQTLDGYRRRLGQFARWLAGAGCDPAQPATWIDYYATLQQRELSPFTRKGHYDRLRRFGRWLAETGRLAGNPMDGIRPPRLPRETIPKAIPREAIRAMLRAADGPRERALLLFFRDTGGRAMEALAATWTWRAGG